MNWSQVDRVGTNHESPNLQTALPRRQYSCRKNTHQTNTISWKIGNGRTSSNSNATRHCVHCIHKLWQKLSAQSSLCPATCFKLMTVCAHESIGESPHDFMLSKYGSGGAGILHPRFQSAFQVITTSHNHIWTLQKVIADPQ